MKREYEAGRLTLGEDALLNPPTQTKMVSTLHDRNRRFKKSQVEFCGMVDVTPQDALLVERPIGGQIELNPLREVEEAVEVLNMQLRSRDRIPEPSTEKGKKSESSQEPAKDKGKRLVEASKSKDKGKEPMVAPDVPAPAPTPPKKNSSGVDDNVLAHLRKISALLTVYVRGVDAITGTPHCSHRRVS